MAGNSLARLAAGRHNAVLPGRSPQVGRREMRSWRRLPGIVADEEHVPDTALPGNVEHIPGGDLEEMLRGGESQAGIGLAVRDETVRPV